MPDISITPTPASGTDRLPDLLADRAKDTLLRKLDTHLAHPADPYRDQMALARESVDRLPDGDLARAVSHPLFKKWSVSDGKATDIQPLDLNRILLAALIEGDAVPDRAMVVPLAEGDLRGPGLRHRRVADEPFTSIRITGDEALLDAGPSRHGVTSRELLHQGVRPLPDADLVLDAGDPVFRRFLARMNAVPGVGTDARRDLKPVTQPSPALIDAYRTVLTLLRECWPEAAAELLRYVRVIVPFESELLLGWATPLFQGAVFVRSAPDDLLFTFERLVHEAAHLRLFAIQHTGRLHDDPPDKRLVSVARPDPRPVIGVFHASFVYARLCEAFAKAIDHGMDERWSARLDTLLMRYRALSRTLHEGATLTALGEDILAQLDARIDALFVR
ncbi:HEXXH motif-containing protein [Nocardia tenerifensis]|uniref:HEXXH motif-containing protein n=1 Tax=Nocardia tenerifensis TaxID=228006 RepID=A0A318KFW5_9NOCA|nr:HEXXH motif-containing putative peptide modification protein [Nocardia tenerifensis]PXX58768.1 HEXXH motif-containing protein [Nocardia tenerifensis]